MKKSIFCLLAAVCMLMWIIACGPSDEGAKQKNATNQSKKQGPEQKQKPIELNYSVFFPPTHVHSKAAEDWAREVEVRTGNAVKINIFPGGTLTGAAECYDGVVSGISDIGMSCFAYSRGRFLVMEAVDLPLGYHSGMVATQVANAFYRQTNPEELKDVKVLYLHAHGPGLLHTKRPVHTLEDIKGMQIRSTGLSTKVVEALGGIPVAMSQGDAYEALQKGVVEGTFAPMETLKGWRQADVVDYTTDCREIGYTTTMFVIINKKRFEQLPEQVQQVISQVSEEWIEVHSRVWNEADSEGLAYTKEKGNEIIELPKEESVRWKAAIEPVIEGYIAEAQKKGIDGRKSVDLLRDLIARYSR